MNENEEKIPGREQKSPKVDLTNETIDKCLCTGCPTYMSNTCPPQKNEEVYCSIGMTDCADVKQEGCVCGNCEVFKEDELKTGYFCFKGEADESGEPAQPEVGV